MTGRRRKRVVDTQASVAAQAAESTTIPQQGDGSTGVAPVVTTVPTVRAWGDDSGIEVRGLSFAYDSHPVLSNVSFRAESGQFLAVLGPNGVGKSTLFYCLLAIRSPDQGQVLLDGRSIHDMAPAKVARRVAYVPQSHAPTFNYSVEDMVLMGTTARVGGFTGPGADELAQAREAMERVGISHLAQRGYMQISGGERQLALIARALAQQARVVVMDEPTANLDYGNQLRVLARVKDLSSQGYTVIVSTHNPDHVFLFADRVLALKDGRVVADGSPGDCLTADLIEDLYGVRVRLRRSEDGHVSCEPLLTHVGTAMMDDTTDIPCHKERDT